MTFGKILRVVDIADKVYKKRLELTPKMFGIEQYIKNLNKIITLNWYSRGNSFCFSSIRFDSNKEEYKHIQGIRAKYLKRDRVKIASVLLHEFIKINKEP